MGRTIASVTVERGTGMDVGCKRDALAAARGELFPIGDGAQRTVYVDARGRFVYKIEKGGYPGSNRDEYEAFRSSHLREMGLGQYGSPVALFTVETAGGWSVEVLAMPVRPKHSHEASPAEQNRFHSRGARRLVDMHPANYRVTPGGRIKITDLGFGLSR